MLFPLTNILDEFKLLTNFDLQKNKSTKAFYGSLGDMIAISCFLYKKEMEIDVVYQFGISPPDYESITRKIYGDHIEYKFLWNKIKNKKNVIKIKNYCDKNDITFFHTETIARDVNLQKRSYNGCVLLRKELANISKFDLPKNYAVIAPYTSHCKSAMTRYRQFKPYQWKKAIDFLKKQNLKGIVLSSDYYDVPKCDQIINLNNRTTFLESIEITKNCDAYYGIDSFLSVIAPKVVPLNKFHVYCKKRSYCVKNKAFYFAPLNNATFHFI